MHHAYRPQETERGKRSGKTPRLMFSLSASDVAIAKCRGTLWLKGAQYAQRDVYFVAMKQTNKYIWGKSAAGRCSLHSIAARATVEPSLRQSG